MASDDMASIEDPYLNVSKGTGVPVRAIVALALPSVIRHQLPAVVRRPEQQLPV